MSQSPTSSLFLSADVARGDQGFAQASFVFGEKPNAWLRDHAHCWGADQ